MATAGEKARMFRGNLRSFGEGPSFHPTLVYTGR